MTSVKHIGLDVRKESISICVRNSVVEVVMESIIETTASIVLQFIDRLRGDLRVTFEEGSWAAWLHDLLNRACRELRSVICARMHCSKMAARVIGNGQNAAREGKAEYRRTVENSRGSEFDCRVYVSHSNPRRVRKLCPG